MPVILDERMAEDWINPREKNPLSLERLLVPTPSDLLVMQPASPLASSVKNEGPTLLKVKRRCSKTAKAASNLRAP
jgi:putative SOS response-associated peptidase YedK